MIEQTSFKIKALIIPLLMWVFTLAFDCQAAPIELEKTWMGTYECSQGETNLELTIFASKEPSIKAIFHFRHDLTGAEGRYFMAGQYDKKSGVLKFEPGEWIQQPLGYTSVGMVGKVFENPLRYQGKIPFEGCGAFILKPSTTSGFPPRFSRVNSYSRPNLKDHLFFTLIVSLFLPVLVTLFARRHYREKQYSPSQKNQTFWPRFLASYVDGLVLWPISFVIPLVLTKSPPVYIGYPLLLIFSTAWYIYSIWLTAIFGQTVGKMVCKVKVVDFKSDGNIGLRQAILRDLVPLLIYIPLFIYQSVLIFGKKLDMGNLYNPELFFAEGKLLLTLMLWVPSGWFLAELITMLTNSKCRALHDYIAGTVVTRTKIREGG